MGNILSYLPSSTNFNPAAWSFTAAVASLVLYSVVKFIVEKPWGISRQYNDAVRRNNERRQAGFRHFRERLNFEEMVKDERILINRKNIESMIDDLEDLPHLQLELLIEHLQNGTFNAYTILCAYVHAALKTNEEINCLTEVVNEAFDYAIAMDEKWYGKKDKPPLYGVPFSVKSNFYMKGYDCTIGVAKLLDQPKDTDCSFVTELMALGAIPFVLTNVPQGLLSYVASNHVYGRTLNPLKLTTTPGGSSGGEAALLAADSSPFGIGSDLGGSLRIPAAFCGLCTLKPTQDRFVVTGTHGGVPGRGRLGLSFGFFTRSVDEQILLLEKIVGTDSYHRLVPQSPPLPLRMKDYEPKQGKPLKYGYFDDDGFCTPAPSNQRAVLTAVDRLRQEGCECVRFEVPRVLDAAKLFYKNVMPDSGAYMRSVYDNETIHPDMWRFVKLLNLPSCIRWFFAKCVFSFFSPQLSLIGTSYMRDISDVRYTQEKTDEYRLEFIAYWKSLGIDALICPSFITPAVPFEYPAEMTNAVFSTGLYNMIDFPAGIVRAQDVTESDVKNILDENCFKTGNNILLKKQRDACKDSCGLPNAVQVVALPFNEEICLHAMKQVESVWSWGYSAPSS